MREILFRGKRIYDGKWLFGNLVVDACGKHHIIKPEFFCEDGHHLQYEDNTDEPVFIHPETVGQYTGLTDKNGKKIFEGDLLDGFEYPFYRSEDSVHNYFAEIVWFDENCAFGIVTHKYPTSKVRGISAGNTDYIEEYDFTEWEVIGNIHDNPELLGGV